MIANAIVAVSHTRYFRFSPQGSPSHAVRSFTIRDRVKCPRRRARSFDEGVTESREKRGFARQLSSFYPLKQGSVFDFLMRILGAQKLTLRIKPRAFACKLCVVFHTRYFRFPLKAPLPTRHAHSPFAAAQSALVEERGHSTRALPSRARSAVSRDIFCSAPPSGCGSVHVLGCSFAPFCVSENVRVPLRYSGQPLHRKIIASRSPNTSRFCLSNRFFAFNQAIDY